jgi:Zn-dependent protease with chaperone function/uncharacterized tellurite resistance protein B-like protein
MDFFAHQDEARRKTGLMVALFAAAVAAIIFALYKTIYYVLAIKDLRPYAFNPRLFAYVSVGVLGLIGGGSLYKTWQLRRGGGAAVAASLGGQPVPADTTDGHERRLLNVVEEMAIASGVPIPAVYILEEDGINAFAAGFTTADAVVAVTRGCLTKLTRDELQGVVAHEFSHILNGDMRLNIRLMGVVHGILLIALIGYHLLRFSGRGRSRKGGGPFVLVALAMFVVGYIGVFFGNLIKAAVSRSREFLADAAAVQFTRNPGGIAGALKKIGGLSAGSAIGHEGAAAASHFYFARGIEASLFSVFSTHPPLAERVRRLEPRFRGEFPEIPGDFVSPLDQETPLLAAGFAAGAGRAAGGAAGAAAAAVVDSVGTMTADGISYAAALLKSLPPELVQAARSPEGARAVLLAMLLDADPAVRAKQRQLLGLERGASAPAAVEALLPPLDALDRRLRLPLADLAVASLRALDAPAAAGFMAEVEAQVSADGRITLPELMLATMIGRRLQPLLGPPDRGGGLRSRGGSLLQGCQVLLGAFARASSEKQGAVRKVYDLGAREFFGERAPEIPGADACRPEMVRQAMEVVRRAPPQARKRILAALSRMAVVDGTVTADEAELLRTVADGIGCPVPPLTATPPPARGATA